MTETIFISAPQAQRRGSTSKIFLNRRAQEARRAWEKSESSSLGSACEFWRLFALPDPAAERARLEKAP
jgi:hypothetical protein